MPLVESTRHVRLDGHTETAKGEGHDREPGQPIGVEVAEDEHPLPEVTGRGQASKQDVRIGQARRVVEAVERIGEPGDEVVAGDRAASRQDAGEPGRDTALGGDHRGRR